MSKAVDSFGHLHMGEANRSSTRISGFIPAGIALLQLAFIGLAVVGAGLVCFLGSEGVAKPNELVHVQLPIVMEGGAEKIDRRDDYIIIGRDLKGSGDLRIQLMDQFVELGDIGPWFRASNAGPCDVIRPKHTAIIYADRDTPMELITAVKQELRAVDQLKVCYAVTPVSWRCWPDLMCLPD